MHFAVSMSSLRITRTCEDSIELDRRGRERVVTADDEQLRRNIVFPPLQHFAIVGAGRILLPGQCSVLVHVANVSGKKRLVSTTLRSPPKRTPGFVL